MDLMELWIENVRRWDEMRASQKDLLSVQKSMEIEGCLALADVRIVQNPWQELPPHKSW